MYTQNRKAYGSGEQGNSSTARQARATCPIRFLNKKQTPLGEEAPGGWVITPPGVFCNAMVTSGSSLDKTCIGLEVGCKGRKKSEKENIYVFMVEALTQSSIKGFQKPETTCFCGKPTTSTKNQRCATKRPSRNQPGFWDS